MTVQEWHGIKPNDNILPKGMVIIDKHEANQYSPLSLAFLGDAVYEQLVREHLMLTANMPPHTLHDEAVRRVRAEYQAKAVKLLDSILTEEERDIIKRGRNASGGLRHVPKSSDRSEYGMATGLEALFGWLRLCEDNERINFLFEYIWERDEM